MKSNWNATRSDLAIRQASNRVTLPPPPLRSRFLGDLPTLLRRELRGSCLAPYEPPTTAQRDRRRVSRVGRFGLLLYLTREDTNDGMGSLVRVTGELLGYLHARGLSNDKCSSTVVRPMVASSHPTGPRGKGRFQTEALPLRAVISDSRSIAA